MAAFLAAARAGDVGGLLALLDPDVVLRADAAAVRAGAPGEVLGAAAVAAVVVSGLGPLARSALVDGLPAAVWAPGGEPRAVFSFVVVGGRIAAMDTTADPQRLRELSITILDR